MNMNDGEKDGIEFVNIYETVNMTPPGITIWEKDLIMVVIRDKIWHKNLVMIV